MQCHRIEELLELLQPAWVKEQDLSLVQFVAKLAAEAAGEMCGVAEADVVNSAGVLRPGMRGSSHVSTGRRLLGWNLFHKPVAYVLGWQGW